MLALIKNTFHKKIFSQCFFFSLSLSFKHASSALALESVSHHIYDTPSSGLCYIFIVMPSYQPGPPRPQVGVMGPSRLIQQKQKKIEKKVIIPLRPLLFSSQAQRMTLLQLNLACRLRRGKMSALSIHTCDNIC